MRIPRKDRGDTANPAAELLEGDGVGFEEEEVEDSVDEGHV